MTELTEGQIGELQDLLSDYISNGKIESKDICNIINRFVPYKDRVFTAENIQGHDTKILLTTGAGNTIQGGADIWVNNFLLHVWPTLPNPKSWKLLIDSKRPGNFRPDSLPKGLQYHFHFDDPGVTQDWLSECSEIHSLHSHYHKREHIWHFEDKFKTCFVHAYPREMNEVIDKIPELKRLQFNTNVDAEFFDDYIATFEKRIWIGNNPTSMFDEFPNYTYSIPNCYEFKNNGKLTTHVDNGKVGFASRAESRKCLHWMNDVEGYALTNQFDVQNLKDTTTYSLNKIQLFNWSPDIYHSFMTKNWGIFHGAYFKEPFGYSIFQAVDYGKLPIIHTDWAKEVDYKYRVSTKNEFNKIIKTILKDSQSEREIEFNKLKNYMKQFDNRDVWVDKVRTKLLS